MVCKLCLTDKKLLWNSHIIPDFMYVYGGLFDDKNRLYKVVVTEGQILTSKLKQTGAKEKNILCRSCDNEVLGKLETYAKMVLYGGVPKKMPPRVDDNGLTYTLCKGIDYSKFKIFLLSLLWRTSISNLPDFEDVKLGSHEDIIRQMILNNNPDVPSNYPCAMITSLNLKEMPHQMIVQPRLLKDDGGHSYLFLIGGVLYIFHVSQHNSFAWVNEYAINLNGELRLIHMSQKLARATINKLVGMNFVQ